MIEKGDITPTQPVEKKEDFPWGGMWMITLLISFMVGHWTVSSNVNKPKPVAEALTISGGTTTEAVTTKTWPELSNKAEEERNKTWRNKPILPAPYDAPPSRIVVGPHVYKIRYTTRKALASQSAYALTNLYSRIIWLNPHTDLRYELSHELMHCAKDAGTEGDRLSGMYNNEENFVEETSPTWLQILRDNPELVAWLVRK